MHRGPFCSTFAHSSGILPFCNFLAYGHRFSRVSSRRARCTDTWRTGPSRACRLVVSLVTSKARSSVISASLRAKLNAHMVPARSYCSARAPISCTVTMDYLVRCVKSRRFADVGIDIASQVAYRVGSQGKTVYALEGASKRELEH